MMQPQLHLLLSMTLPLARMPCCLGCSCRSCKSFNIALIAVGDSALLPVLAVVLLPVVGGVVAVADADCWLLFVVVCCCLSINVCCFLLVVCCVLFVVCCWFVVCCLLFAVCGLWFAVCGLLVVVFCLLFVVYRFLFCIVVFCLLFVGCLLSFLVCCCRGCWFVVGCLCWRVPERPRRILAFFGVGVGWGDDKVLCTCTHVECYATCLGWVGWGDDNVPCTCTHVECYATCLGWVGWGDDNVSLHLYTCSMLLNLSGVGGVGGW